MEAVRFSGSGVVGRTSLLSFDGLRLSLVPFRIPSSVGACGVGLGQRSFRGLTVKAATVVAPKFLIPAGNMLRESTGLSFHWFFMASQKRTMTKSRRVQDRSKKKRVHDLEIATERSKVTSKVLVVIEALKREPEQVIPLKRLEQYRQQINLSKPHKVVHFIRKSPKLFELYRDKKGVIWCGLTKEAEDLVEEETRLLEEHSEKAVEYVTRLLMMSVNKRLSVDKIAHFRRDFGLPYDFRNRWIHMFPDHFKVVRIEDAEYLQLVSWNPAWAVTELEKKAMATGTISDISSESEVLFLPFPMKFPSNYKKLFRYGGKIEHFQKRSHLSPYADAKGLSPGSQEFDKRAVAIMHEILSFTIEKRLVTDHLTHFRREFVMPQKLMRLLLKHFGIFYVSERGKRLSVFLTEAYEGSELADKCPLVLWKEKILRFTGYRGRRKRIESFNEFSDVEGPLFDGDFDNQTTFMNLEDDEIDGTIDDSSLADDSEMKVDLFFYRDPEEAKEQEEEALAPPEHGGIADYTSVVPNDQWTAEQWVPDMGTAPATVPASQAPVPADGWDAAAAAAPAPAPPTEGVPPVVPSGWEAAPPAPSGWD